MVPFPWDVSLPVVASYQTALVADDANAKPGFVSLEGYLTGRLTVEELKRIDGEPTREKLLNAIYGAPFDLGGLTLSYGPDKPGLRSSLLHSSPSRRLVQARHALDQHGGRAVTLVIAASSGCEVGGVARFI